MLLQLQLLYPSGPEKKETSLFFLQPTVQYTAINNTLTQGDPEIL